MPAEPLDRLFCRCGLDAPWRADEAGRDCAREETEELGSGADVMTSRGVVAVGGEVVEVLSDCMIRERALCFFGATKVEGLVGGAESNCI